MYLILSFSLVLSPLRSQQLLVEQRDNIIVRLVGRITCSWPSLYLGVWLWIFIIDNQPALDGIESAVAE